MEVGAQGLHARARVAREPGGGAEDRAPDAVTGRLGVAIAWLRRNLFSSVGNTALTLAVVALLALALPPFVEWSVTQATFSGTSRSACAGEGACWTFIKVRLPLFFYGHYPEAELWRVGAVALLMAGFGAQVLRENVRRRGLWLLMLLTVFPALAAVLLVGGVPGLPYVDTNLWGGLMLDVLIAFVTVAGALPLGVLLALGRRSQLPIVRYLSVGFIEFWRGVPLLTVLFMSAVMVPLFLPNGVSVDRLIRALVALILFNAAYMAETVRGGLQGVVLGQEEAAYSVGLGWWQVQAFVVLPQALRHVMPGIVNNVVDLFKDTTLVTIIGLFDILGAVNQALKDPAWLGFAKEGYVFTMVVFFACCFAMSSYARRMERRLNRHRSGRH
ncbi:MAG TPA: amino acid ABC transporter permease [Stellaceae bacterium]|nr:amino acid ABC transporter permease [Stellaceae bacterium]